MEDQNRILSPFSLEAEKENYASQGKLVALGTVVEQQEEKIWVVTEQDAGCKGCATESGCGTSALAKLFSPNKNAPLLMLNDLGVKKGDLVLLSIDESDLFKHSMMAYGLPLFLMIGLASVGLAVTQSDQFSILFGFFGLGLGWWSARHFYHPKQPKLERVIQAE
ncbi:SoxR reducing system RseC family protein [Hydrogenovibrio kuenenii]|uniref:SoxR reducing system RseC family protein n=1 Tax=Hydrogenovibrio kuenenii TaxID=63658 RepID=UPI000464640F|nr:SoxR reducing system RseC family protein [Hydrogenovibrio kuenenii]